jgi:hypothetical protein
MNQQLDNFDPNEIEYPDSNDEWLEANQLLVNNAPSGGYETTAEEDYNSQLYQELFGEHNEDPPPYDPDLTFEKALEQAADISDLFDD